MKSRWLLTLAIPLSFGAVSTAGAQEPECPPGEWFCDDAAELDEAGGESEIERSELPGESPDERDDEREALPPGATELGPYGRPTLDVRRRSRFRPGRDDVDGLDGPSPWSIALRLQGVMLGDGRRRGHDARMGGVGASVRYRVNPVVTLDLGLDSLLGTDYNGYDREELSLSFSSLFYLNQHRLIRTYVLFGLNTSTARVDVAGDGQSFRYFGAHTGLGLDIKLDPRVALNLDLLGFMRGRTDARAAREPEFIDASGRVTNTSGGGLFRGGISLSW